MRPLGRRRQTVRLRAAEQQHRCKATPAQHAPLQPPPPKPERPKVGFAFPTLRTQRRYALCRTRERSLMLDPPHSHRLRPTNRFGLTLQTQQAPTHALKVPLHHADHPEPASFRCSTRATCFVSAMHRLSRAPSGVDMGTCPVTASGLPRRSAAATYPSPVRDTMICTHRVVSKRSHASSNARRSDAASRRRHGTRRGSAPRLARAPTKKPKKIAAAAAKST
jgi:hypothetical protein